MRLQTVETGPAHKFAHGAPLAAPDLERQQPLGRQKFRRSLCDHPVSRETVGSTVQSLDRIIIANIGIQIVNGA